MSKYPVLSESNWSNVRRTFSINSNVQLNGKHVQIRFCSSERSTFLRRFFVFRGENSFLIFRTSIGEKTQKRVAFCQKIPTILNVSSNSFSEDLFRFLAATFSTRRFETTKLFSISADSSSIPKQTRKRSDWCSNLSSFSWPARISCDFISIRHSVWSHHNQPWTDQVENSAHHRSLTYFNNEEIRWDFRAMQCSRIDFSERAEYQRK